MKKSILLLSCLILLVGTISFAEGDNAYSGKVHNKKMSGVERTLKGELVCLGCDLKESGARSDCTSHGHSIRLKSQNGLYLTILSNQYSTSLLTDAKMLHKPIEITGYHFANAQTLDVISYTIDSTFISWCTLCSKMDNCAQKK